MFDFGNLDDIEENARALNEALVRQMRRPHLSG